MLQQYRELQLAFYKKKRQLIIWQTIVQKNSLQIVARQFTFLLITFYPFYKVGVGNSTNLYWKWQTVIL